MCFLRNYYLVMDPKVLYIYKYYIWQSEESKKGKRDLDIERKSWDVGSHAILMLSRSPIISLLPLNLIRLTERSAERCSLRHYRSPVSATIDSRALSRQSKGVTEGLRRLPPPQICPSPLRQLNVLSKYFHFVCLDADGH